MPTEKPFVLFLFSMRKDLPEPVLRWVFSPQLSQYPRAAGLESVDDCGNQFSVQKGKKIFVGYPNSLAEVSSLEKVTGSLPHDETSGRKCRIFGKLTFSSQIKTQTFS